MRKIYNVTSEGQMTLTQYQDGDAVLFDAESGDTIFIDARDLPKVGRLAIAAHVVAGQLRNPENIGRMKQASK